MDISLIATIITSISTIGGVFIGGYKIYKKIEDKCNKIEETLNINTIHLLKIAVLDDKLPLIDRIHAGEQYISLGGNGTIKRVYMKLLDEYEKEQ
jgi:hypothetical protein